MLIAKRLHVKEPVFGHEKTFFLMVGFNGMMNQIFTMEKCLFIVPGTHDFPLPCYSLLQKVSFEEFVRDY